ncbi:MAK10-like protein [Tanacetum coccineum]
MENENPIRTLGDYSRPSHEGYRNTIELPDGNNVVPLRSDTIREINRVGGKLRDKNAEESLEIIDNLALYDYEDWDDPRDFTKPVKAISFPQNTPKMPGRRLLELEDQISYLLKGSRTTPETSSTHIPQAYTKDAGKVLVREEVRHSVTQNVNAISLVKMDKEKNTENNEVVDKNVIELSELNVVDPEEVVDVKEEVENGTNNEEIRSMKEKITGEEIEELMEMPRYNESFLATRLGRLKYMDALVDQGSDVNVMPLSIYNRLTNKKPIGTNIRLSIASHSYIFPLGIAEDVLVEIVGYVYPVDFVILDVKEDKKKPFILGTPFLTTAKFEIRFDKGTITLKSGKNKINFFKIPESPRRVEVEIKNDIDLVAPTNTLSRLILEWEERIKLHQEKEMEFNQ